MNILPCKNVWCFFSLVVCVSHKVDYVSFFLFSFFFHPALSIAGVCAVFFVFFFFFLSLVITPTAEGTLQVESCVVIQNDKQKFPRVFFFWRYFDSKFLSLVFFYIHRILFIFNEGKQKNQLHTHTYIQTHNSPKIQKPEATKKVQHDLNWIKKKYRISCLLWILHTSRSAIVEVNYSSVFTYTKHVFFFGCMCPSNGIQKRTRRRRKTEYHWILEFHFNPAFDCNQNDLTHAYATISFSIALWFVHTTTITTAPDSLSNKYVCLITRVREWETHF